MQKQLDKDHNRDYTGQYDWKPPSVGQRRDIGEPPCTAGKVGQILDNELDCLADSKGGNNKIVIPKTQRGVADQLAHNSRGRGPQDDAYRNRHPQPHHNKRGDIAADGHKSGVAHGEEAGKTAQDGYPQNSNHIDAG